MVVRRWVREKVEGRSRKGEKEGDRIKERQNQHEGYWASSWGLRRHSVSGSSTQAARGALLAGWSPDRLGPVGMRLVGAPAG